MTKQRTNSLRRIALLQEQICNLKKWRVAHLESERQTLSQAHVEVMAAMERDLASFGPLAVAATRRLRTLEKEMAMTALERQSQERQLIAHTIRSKMIDQVIEAADAQQRSQDERKELSDIIESWQMLKTSSPG
jgi:hypothetical protein